MRIQAIVPKYIEVDESLAQETEKINGVVSFSANKLFPDSDNAKYICVTLKQRDEIAKTARLDMSTKDCKWQCPECKNRVGCQQPLGHKGKPVTWGCRLYCDYTDKDYFKGHACKLFEHGAWDGYYWP